MSNATSSKRKAIRIPYISLIDQCNNELQLFRIFDIVADGNCLFRALSKGLLSTQSEYRQYRRHLVQYIVADENWRRFYCHIRAQHEDHIISIPRVRGEKQQPVNPEEGNNNNNNNEIEDCPEVVEYWRKSYKTFMLKPKTFGTMQELFAASDAFKFTIVLIRRITEDYFNIMVMPDTPIHTKILCFLHTGAHADTGHFEYVEPCNETDFNQLKFAKGYYKLIRREIDNRSYIYVIQEASNPQSSPVQKTSAESNDESSLVEIPSPRKQPEDRKAQVVPPLPLPPGFRPKVISESQYPTNDEPVI